MSAGGVRIARNVRPQPGRSSVNAAKLDDGLID